MEEYQQYFSIIALERFSCWRKCASDGWSCKENEDDDCSRGAIKGGGVHWLVEQLLRDSRNMGAHGKVILNSDQENSILDVLSDVCKQRRKDNDSAVALVESSPKGESQSSGIAESGTVS